MKAEKIVRLGKLEKRIIFTETANQRRSESLSDSTEEFAALPATAAAYHRENNLLISVPLLPTDYKDYGACQGYTALNVIRR